MRPDVEHRLRYALAERDQGREQIVAVLREIGVLRLLRQRTLPGRWPLVDGLVLLVRREAELSEAVAPELDRAGDEAAEE
jgi:hypothetical protein